MILTIAALVLGSFVNAYIYRTYKKESGGNKNLSIVSGRSICPNCKHQLSGVDLIPVLSWVALKGKCRYCNKPISVQYPLVELLTVGVFLFSYFYWSYSFSSISLGLFIFWLLILVILIALTIYDIKYMLLPNSMLYSLIVFAAGFLICKYIFLNSGLSFWGNAAVGFVVGGGIYYLIYQFSKGKLIGGGDVKLGAILGLILGSGVNAILMIFISSLLGTLFAVPLLLGKKLKRKALIPYGPFLIVAAIILVFFSSSLKNWLKTRGIYLN